MWDVFANQNEKFDSFVTPLLSLKYTHSPRLMRIPLV